MATQSLAVPSITPPPASYDAIPGLTQSGLKDLAVSPLCYWQNWINPNREPREDTAATIMGTALHCAVLEPDQFKALYAPEPELPENALTTAADIREWIVSKGGKPKGTLKAGLIAQALEIDPSVAIEDLLIANHIAANEGKTILPWDTWDRVIAMRDTLLCEPNLVNILKEGEPEVTLRGKHTETGVPLKCRLDWKHPKLTLDLKSFTQKGTGKPIDRCITDIIFFEKYYRQAVFYTMMRGWPKEFKGEFVFAFIESEPPYETRLRVLRPTTAGQPNLYWQTALNEINELVRQYAACQKLYGEKPWRDGQRLEPLFDEEMPQIAYTQGVIRNV